MSFLLAAVYFLQGKSFWWYFGGTFLSNSNRGPRISSKSTTVLHGCCWETFVLRIFDYWGLVVGIQIHLTAKQTLFFAAQIQRQPSLGGFKHSLLVPTVSFLLAAALLSQAFVGDCIRSPSFGSRTPSEVGKPHTKNHGIGRSPSYARLHAVPEQKPRLPQA